MGGNALSIPSRRIPRAEYETLSINVLSRLWSYNRTERAEIIPAYRQKVDFGDMDVLVVWREGAELGRLIAIVKAMFYDREAFEDWMLMADQREKENMVRQAFSVRTGQVQAEIQRAEGVKQTIHPESN